MSILREIFRQTREVRPVKPGSSVVRSTVLTIEPVQPAPGEHPEHPTGWGRKTADWTLAQKAAIMREAKEAVVGKGGPTTLRR